MTDNNNTHPPGGARGIFSNLLGAGTTNMHDPATCINCGCSDLQRCAQGCHWLGANRLTRRGVCSNCPQALAEFSRRPV